jgi:hypothetical protein
LKLCARWMRMKEPAQIEILPTPMGDHHNSKT